LFASWLSHCPFFHATIASALQLCLDLFFASWLSQNPTCRAAVASCPEAASASQRAASASRHAIASCLLAPLLLFVGDNTKGLKLTAARPAAKVRFAVDVEAHAVPTAEPTKQDQKDPIKMVGGRACPRRLLGH